MANPTKSLEAKIEHAVEQLVLEHLAACEAAAEHAVRAAFRRASSSVGPKAGRRRSPRAPGRRRSQAEMLELVERLYSAICRHPGEKMTVIAPVVGASARELERPSRRLRDSGRVRTVGRRGATRYFPMGE